MVQAPKLLKAYLAGFFDGEGSIFILRQKRKKLRDRITYSTKVEVSNTVKEPLELLHSNYSGTIYTHIRQSEKRKPIYIWSLSNRKAYQFLKDIKPYLIIKKAQAQIGIELQERVAKSHIGIWLTPEEREKREQLRLKLKALTKRGIEI